MTDRCIETPISWLVLERRALGELEPGAAGRVDAHLARCPACRGCYESLAVEVSLRPLAIAAAAPTRRFRLTWAMAPALALAVLTLIFFARDEGGRTSSVGAGAGGVKGGDIAIELVRESGGALLAPTHFARGDRFKVLVSCKPGASLRVEVAVYQTSGVSRPLPPAHLRCGNGVAVPGAFRLSGGPARVCLLTGDQIEGTAPPDDAPCVAVAPAR